MTDEAREQERQYRKAWRKANRDKIRRYNENYWEKKARQMKQEAANTDGEDLGAPKA